MPKYIFSHQVEAIRKKIKRPPITAPRTIPKITTKEETKTPQFRKLERKNPEGFIIKGKGTFYPEDKTFIPEEWTKEKERRERMKKMRLS